MSDFAALMLYGVIRTCCGQFVDDAVGFPRSGGRGETPELSEHTESNEFEAGNTLTETDQAAKLRLFADVAREVWRD